MNSKVLNKQCDHAYNFVCIHVTGGLEILKENPIIHRHFLQIIISFKQWHLHAYRASTAHIKALLYR